MSGGYRDCACPDCVEIAIGEDGALCHDCESVGCDGEGECESPYAYGQGFCESCGCDFVAGEAHADDCEVS